MEFSATIKLNLKRRVCEQCFLLVMACGAETWTLTQHCIQKVQVAQRKMERGLFGFTLSHKIINSEMRSRTKFTEVAHIIIQNK